MSKYLNLNERKLGVFYDTDVDSDYLKKIHFDAYEQTIQRQFANEVKNDTACSQSDDSGSDRS